MRRAKSRNFILMICGVLITLLLGVMVAKGVIAVWENPIDEDLNQNILSSSSKIELYGQGNFIDSTPKLLNTTIIGYSVKLQSVGDSVFYSMGFCNMNNYDVKFNGLVSDKISCISVDDDSCQNVFVDMYVTKKNQKLKVGNLISANSCVAVVIDTKYVGDISVDTEVYIDKVSLRLENKR